MLMTILQFTRYDDHVGTRGYFICEILNRIFAYMDDCRVKNNDFLFSGGIHGWWGFFSTHPPPRKKEIRRFTYISRKVE